MAPRPGCDSCWCVFHVWTSFFNVLVPSFQFDCTLLGKTKIARDKAEAIMILPHWPTAAWYSMVPDLLIDTPRSLPRKGTLLRSQLRQVACRLSGNHYNVTAFRQQLKVTSSTLGGRARGNNTSRTLKDGRAFVYHDGFIPIYQL